MSGLLKNKTAILAAAAFLVLPAVSVLGADSGASASEVGVDTLWVTIAAMLVFFMQAGFGMVEAGFIRAKNSSNILMKNFIDYCAAIVMFFIVGYAFMFGSGNSFIGWTGFGLEGVPDIITGTHVHKYAFWFFQAAFCGAAASIVAGGMAERMKFAAYIIYTIAISSLVYPIVGHWVWTEGGWLAKMGFKDFAGSTVVHITGGWAAFIGTIILGPRIGKYKNGGKPKAIAGHNIPLACLGVFILWFGWFGFNPGSTVSVGNGSAFARVAMNTNLAAAVGALSAMAVVWIFFGKPDLSMTMNGALAGLVAVTGPCAFIDPWAAIAVGAVAGILVVVGVSLLDHIHVDDPVGAVAVHGFNGIWGHAGHRHLRSKGPGSAGRRPLLRRRFWATGHSVAGRGDGGRVLDRLHGRRVPGHQVHDGPAGAARRRVPGPGHRPARHGVIRRVPDLRQRIVKEAKP